MGQSPRRIFVQSQKTSLKLIITHQGGNSTFTMKMSGPRLLLLPWKRHINIMDPLTWCPVWEEYLCGILAPQKQNFHLTMKIYPTNSNWMTVYKILTSFYPQEFQGYERQEKSKELSQIRRDKEDMTLGVMWCPGLGTTATKGHCWRNWGNANKVSRLVYRIVPLLIS